MTVIKEENYRILTEKDYGIEEMKNGHIHLYSPKFLFIDSFKSQAELSQWIKENLK